MRPAIHLALLCVVTLAVACGSNPPTSPSPPLTGPWNGTWQYVSGGATVTDTVNATISDNGTELTGTWTSASGATGTLRFAPGPAIKGTFSIAQPWFTGGVCAGNTTLEGTASASAVDFTLAQIPPSGVCIWGSNQKFSLHK